MKTLCAVILVLLVSGQSYGQLFKKNKAAADTAQVQTAPAKTMTDSLAVKSDSLAVGLSETKTEKSLVLNDTDTPSLAVTAVTLVPPPVDTTQKLVAVREELPASAAVQPSSRSDSISLLLKENFRLRSELDSLNASRKEKEKIMTSQEVERANAIQTLKQLRELVDAKILTEAEFIVLKKKYVEKL